MMLRMRAFLLLCLTAGAVAAAPLPLTLEAAEAGLAHNREVLAAQRGVESARAGVTVAGQAPNPSLSWGATAISPHTGIGGGGLKDRRMDQTLAISQLIERGNKRELRSAGAAALLAAAAADLADTRRQQRLLLHQSYFDLKAAQEKALLSGDTADLYEKSLAAARLRHQAGDIAAVETSRLHVEALRARNDERAAQADLARARQTLAYLIGETSRAAEIVAVTDWPQSTASVTDVSTAIERRPDLRAARARVEAARQARALARSQQTRDVTVGAQVERYPPDTPGVTYGVSLSVPLFVRHDNEGEIAQAETACNMALEAAETVLVQARQDVARAANDLASAAERRRRVEADVLPQARHVAAAVEFAYAKGAASLTDLLDARRTLRALELDALASLVDHARALAAWRAATEWETAAP